MTVVATILAVLAIVISLAAALFALGCLAVLNRQHPLPVAPDSARVRTTHVMSGSSLEAEEL